MYVAYTFLTPLNASDKKHTNQNMKIIVLFCNEMNKSTSHIHIMTNKVLIKMILSILIYEHSFVSMGFYSSERRVTEMLD